MSLKETAGIYALKKILQYVINLFSSHLKNEFTI